MRRRNLMLAAAALGVTRAVHAAPPVVVLELFTSQGCSSCPPADALLGELAGQPGIVALAWHVDYWNGLGWRDPYATSVATERQRAYAARLGQEVYTPALVVNGAQIVVGSDRSAVAQAIAQARAASVPVALHRDPAGLSADIGATSTALTALSVAFDPMRVTAIGGGENGGRQLTEYHIVRAAVPLGNVPDGAGRIALPPIAPDRATALLLQTPDLRIAGAAVLPAMVG